MQRVSDVLPEIYRNLTRGKADEEALVLGLWPVVVGDRVAARTKAVRLFGSTLIVEASAQDWRKQLARMTGTIVDKLNATAGKVLVQDIDFRVAVRTAPRPLGRAASATGDKADEAAGIGDPELRRLYERSRRLRTRRTGTKG
jgi:predicted nucleic acid-binding Zn ribbon protein